MKTIDLDKYRTRIGQIRSKVFTGRDRGEDVRSQSGINTIYTGSDDITIKIPNDIFSITPSFLEEFFREIVQKFGRENVKSHIKFEGDYQIQSAFNEAVDRISMTKTGLD